MKKYHIYLWRASTIALCAFLLVAAIDYFDNVKISGTLFVDTIDEKTAAHGVEIDGVLLKDGTVGGAVSNTLFDANTILKADTDNTPAALTVGEQTLVGRITAGVITALTATQVRTLINVEDGADVTDAANIASAGGLLDTDFTSDGYMVRSGAGTYVVRAITETTGETSVTNPDGTGGNTTVGIADNANLPGTEGVNMAGGTTGERPGSPVEGDLRRNTTTNGLEYYNGSTWTDLVAGADDDKVKVSADDTTAGYLADKIPGGTGVTMTETNPGANETWVPSLDINGLTTRSAFGSGDKIAIYEAGVGIRKVDYDDLPGAGGGEANTASNQGSSGAGFYKQKTGVDLEFYKLHGTEGAAVALSGTDYVHVQVDISPLTEETSPGDDDLFLMERNSDGLMRKVKASNLPGSGGGGISGDAARLGEIQQIAAAAASVYTNPAATDAEVHSIIIHNTNTTTENVELWNVPDSGGALGTAADANKFYKVAVSANETVIIDCDEVGLVLNDTNDSIQAATDTASKVTIQLMGATATTNKRLTEITQVAAAAGAVFTNPGSTTTKINSVIIHNTNTTTENVEIWNVPDSGGAVGTAADANKFYKIAVSANETVILDFTKYGIVLTDTNDTIQAATDTASKVTIQIFGSQ